MEQQLKGALSKLKEYWENLAPKRKKLFLIAAVGFMVLALGLVLVLNFSGTSMVPLYDGLETEESSEIYSALREQGFSARLNSNGQVEIARAEKERAIGQMAIQNFPKSAPPYKYFTGTSGLTTTDMERRELQKQELQDRLQTTILRYEGVKNVVVTIDLPQSSSFPWAAETQRATGSVSLVLESGYTPSRDQVSGIKYLVAKSVGQGMAVGDVTVADAATWINLKSRDDDSAGSGLDMDAQNERLALQEKVEQQLVDKARNILSLAFQQEDMRISATVQFDYDKVVTESKEYRPSEDSTNNAGVLESQDKNYTMDGNQMAGGIVGEEENTDNPAPVYPDADGDGTPDSINYQSSQNYAVSYVLSQIEKDNSTIVNATMAITVRGDLNANERDVLIESASKATGIAEEDISVQSIQLGEEDDNNGNAGAAGQPAAQIRNMIFIGGAVVLVLLLLLIMMLLGASSKKKKKLAKAKADAEKSPRVVEQGEDQVLLQQQEEMEAHRRQLHQAAELSKMDDAILGDVRDFAQGNPEITANLLRAWLSKEEDEE